MSTGVERLQEVALLEEDLLPRWRVCTLNLGDGSSRHWDPGWMGVTCVRCTAGTLRVRRYLHLHEMEVDMYESRFEVELKLLTGMQWRVVSINVS